MAEITVGSNTFTITGLSTGLSNFTFGEDSLITATLNSQSVTIGSVTSVQSDDKTTYNITLQSNAIDTTKSDFGGITLSSDSSIYFGLSVAGYEMWSTAQTPTLVTVESADKYVYTAGYSAGFTKDIDKINYLEYDWHSAAGGDSFTVEGAGSLSTANVLNYIEISSYDDLKKYFNSTTTYSSAKYSTLKSGYYKITGNVELTDEILWIASNTNVVLDIASTGSISQSSSWTLGDSYYLLYVQGSGNLTIQGEGTITADKTYGVFLQGGNSVVPTLTVNGNVTIKAKSAAISGNNTVAPTKIIINGGTITATDGPGIYHPQNGDLVINGGTISGKTGIEMRSGNLYVTSDNATISATENTYSCTPSGNGYTTNGAAIAVNQYTNSNDKYLSVNIAGGSLSGAKAVAVNRTNGNATSDKPVDINITGGTFTGDLIDNLSDVTLNIAGGTINGNLSSTLTSGEIFDIYTDDTGTSFATINGTIPSSGVSTVEENAPQIAVPQIESAGAIILGKDSVIINSSALSGTNFSFKGAGKYANLGVSLGADVSTLDSDGRPSVYEYGGFSDYTASSAIYTTDMFSDYSSLISSDGGTTVKTYDSVGGASFTFGGLDGITLASGQSLADYVKAGHISVTDNGTLTDDGQFTISGYSFTIRKGLVENLKTGSSIYIESRECSH